MTGSFVNLKESLAYCVLVAWGRACVALTKTGLLTRQFTGQCHARSRLERRERWPGQCHARGLLKYHLPNARFHVMIKKTTSPGQGGEVDMLSYRASLNTK